MSIKFTNDHEWVETKDGTATVGITNYAQEQLGDVVFVDLPEVGDTIEQGEETGVIESVKAASEVFAPVTGEIMEINDALDDDPALINSSAEGDGWMYKIKLSNTAQLDDLLDKDAYTSLIEELE
jgi:glycine cleavage system H protein